MSVRPTDQYLLKTLPTSFADFFPIPLTFFFGKKVDQVVAARCSFEHRARHFLLLVRFPPSPKSFLPPVDDCFFWRGRGPPDKGGGERGEGGRAAFSLKAKRKQRISAL